jgi:hypothetical protein
MNGVSADYEYNKYFSVIMKFVQSLQNIIIRGYLSLNVKQTFNIVNGLSIFDRFVVGSLKIIFEFICFSDREITNEWIVI